MISLKHSFTIIIALSQIKCNNEENTTWKTNKPNKNRTSSIADHQVTRMASKHLLMWRSHVEIQKVYSSVGIESTLQSRHTLHLSHRQHWQDKVIEIIANRANVFMSTLHSRYHPHISTPGLMLTLQALHKASTYVTIEIAQWSSSRYVEFDAHAFCCANETSFSVFSSAIWKFDREKKSDKLKLAFARTRHFCSYHVFVHHASHICMRSDPQVNYVYLRIVSTRDTMRFYASDFKWCLRLDPANKK